MKLVIFDCDGTLIDSQHNITAAMTHAFVAHELTPPKLPDILGVVGLSLGEAFEVLAPDAEISVRRSLAEHYRDAFAGGALQRGSEPLYPGIAEIITSLRAREGVVLGIATGKSRRGVRRLLEEQGWEGAFVTIQTADDHPSKPHPSMILTAMAETGAAPAATVMIGDTAFDMEMALGARVGALGVGWGYHTTERLLAAGAHEIAGSAVELSRGIEAFLDQPLAQS